MGVNSQTPQYFSQGLNYHEGAAALRSVSAPRILSWSGGALRARRSCKEKYLALSQGPYMGVNSKKPEYASAWHVVER